MNKVLTALLFVLLFLSGCQIPIDTPKQPSTVESAVLKNAYYFGCNNFSKCGSQWFNNRAQVDSQGVTAQYSAGSYSGQPPPEPEMNYLRNNNSQQQKNLNYQNEVPFCYTHTVHGHMKCW